MPSRGHGHGRCALLCAVALHVGCADPPGGGDGHDSGTTPMPDGGSADAALGFDIAAPASVTGPAPAVLTPCPSGWLASDATAGPVTCEPLPGPDVVCAADQARFVGETGCAPIGSACPADRWPEGLPATGVLYVDPVAAPGGAGTHDSPFTTIVEALAVASAGAIVALAKGMHAPPGTIGVGVELRGACVGETRIACAPADDAVDPIVITVTGVAIRDVHVADCLSGVYIPMSTDADYTLENVLLTGHRSIGIRAMGGRGSAHSVVIRNPRFDVATAHTGWGIGMNFGATLDARRVAIEGAAGYPIVASSQSMTPGPETFAQFEDLLVRDTLPEGATREDGSGLTANTGARVVVRRALFSNNRATGAWARFGGTLDLEDVVVRGTGIEESDRAYGMALLAGEGSELTVRRAWLHDNPSGGVWVRDADSTVTAEDVVVQDAAGHPDGTGAFGLAAIMRGHLSAARVHVENIRGVGAASVALGSRLELDDVMLHTILGQPSDGDLGSGVMVMNGSTASLRRVAMQDVRSSGVGALFAGSVVVAEDVSVRDLRVKDGNGLPGCAVGALEGAELTAARVHVEGIAGAGLCFLALDVPGTHIAVTDAVVRDVAEAEGIFGYAVAGSRGSRAELSRVRLEGFTTAGVIVADEGTLLTLEDAVILDGRGWSADGSLGYGLAIEASAHAIARRVLVSHAREMGVFVSAASLELEHVAVRDVDLDRARARARGINVQEGGSLDGTDVSVERAADFGLLVRDVGSALRGTGVRVIDTLGVPCATPGCRTLGIGVGAVVDSNASIRDFVVTRCVLAGVDVARGGTMDLSNGEVSHCAVGANVDTDGFDVARISDSVVYRDNGTNLQAMFLPVPDPGQSPPSPAPQP